MPDARRKVSCTIPCSSAFRDAVLALAERRGGNAGDLARSVTLLLPDDVIRAFPDPGGPPPGDRDTVVLRSGPSAGRPWRRKPRLQVRMADGYDPAFLRRALGIALALARGEAVVRLDTGNGRDGGAEAEERRAETAALAEEVARLRAAVSALSFDPVPGGVSTREQALHVLGFAPGERPDTETVKARFRMLATIHHPDSGFGSNRRMSQLNSAMALLRGGIA